MTIVYMLEKKIRTLLLHLDLINLIRSVVVLLFLWRVFDK